MIADRQGRRAGDPGGEPPVVVFLHGQPGGARDWDRVLARLDGRVDALASDRPGWDGRSRAQDLPGNAAAVIAALDARGVERATLVGHSLGAAVAVWSAVEHPDRVAALVLAAPAANLASLGWLDRWLALPVAGPLSSAASMTSLGLVLRAGPLRSRLARGTHVTDEYLRLSAGALLSGWARRAFMVEQRSLVRDLPRLEPRLGSIRAPTQILTGAYDWIVPGAAPRALASQIPGAELIELGRAGHLIPQLHARPLVDAVMRATMATAAD